MTLWEDSQRKAQTYTHVSPAYVSPVCSGLLSRRCNLLLRFPLRNPRSHINLRNTLHEDESQRFPADGDSEKLGKYVFRSFHVISLFYPQNLQIRQWETNYHKRIRWRLVKSHPEDSAWPDKRRKAVNLRTAMLGQYPRESPQILREQLEPDFDLSYSGWKLRKVHRLRSCCSLPGYGLPKLSVHGYSITAACRVR